MIASHMLHCVASLWTFPALPAPLPLFNQTHTVLV
jgi:hypothetical protein